MHKYQRITHSLSIMHTSKGQISDRNLETEINYRYRDIAHRHGNVKVQIIITETWNKITCACQTIIPWKILSLNATKTYRFRSCFNGKTIRLKSYQEFFLSNELIKVELPP